jgi:hypothetical protein
MTRALPLDCNNARSSHKKTLTFIDLDSIESLLWLTHKPILYPGRLSYL